MAVFTVTPSIVVTTLKSTGSFTITLASSGVSETFNISAVSNSFGRSIVSSPTSVIIASNEFTGTFTFVPSGIDTWNINVSSVSGGSSGVTLTSVPASPYDYLFNFTGEYNNISTPLNYLSNFTGEYNNVSTPISYLTNFIGEYNNVSTPLNYLINSTSTGETHTNVLVDLHTFLYTSYTSTGSINTYLSLTKTATGNLSTKLTLKAPITGSINTKLVLSKNVSGSLNTFLTTTYWSSGSLGTKLTLKASPTGSVSTKLTLSTYSTGHLTTSLRIGTLGTGSINTFLTLYGGNIQNVTTSLTLYSPFNFIPQSSVSIGIGALLSSDNISPNRYKGKRESIKILSIEKFVTTNVSKALKVNLRSNTSLNSYNISYIENIRKIQKYRFQIDWRNEKV